MMTHATPPPDGGHRDLTRQRRRGLSQTQDVGLIEPHKPPTLVVKNCIRIQPVFSGYGFVVSLWATQDSNL